MHNTFIYFTGAMLLLILIPLPMYAKSPGTLYPYANASCSDCDLVMPLSRLRQMFTGEVTRWDNGQKIKVVVFDKDVYEQRQFIRETLGLSVSTFYRKYRKNASGTFYEKFADKRTMVDIMKKNPGSIGLIGNRMIVVDKGSIKPIIIDYNK